MGMLRAELSLSSTPMFGRERELSTVCQLLVAGQHRLVTLTGAGGAGKSRLARAVTETLAATFGDAAFFVDLATVHDADLVPAAIAQVLGVQESGTRTLREILIDLLRERPSLVVLDNFEQLRDAALFVAELLIACPRLVLLVTTRETLNLRQEQVFEVEPLRLPDLSGPLDVATLEQIPSVALFVERARTRRASFELTAQNARAVGEVCVRLDGLPLAIELAAAQVAVFSPQAILTRLSSRAPLVISAPSDLPPRHQTLDATVAWSYDLLNEDERAVFRSCGVFVGGCTAEAVEAVLSGPNHRVSALETLAVLVGKSLIRLRLQPVDDESEEPRFGMLETLRDYANEQLAVRGELEEARRRHAGYYLELANAVQADLRGSGMAAALNHLSLEYANFREVFRWASEVGELTVGLRLAGALYRFWLARGHLTEARQWLEPALARGAGAAPEIRGVALNAAGVLAGMQHDHLRAVSFFEESIDVWGGLDDHAGLANAHLNLGLVAHNLGDLSRAEIQFRRAQDLYSDVGDNSGLGRAVGSLARLAREAGDLESAVELFERCLVLLRAVDDEWGVANALANLGQVMLAFGERARARDYFGQALDVRVRLGNVLGVAECLEGFAGAAVDDQPQRAVVLLGAAAELRERAGAPVPASEQVRYDQLRERARHQQTEESFAAAWAEGHGLTMQSAIELATRSEPSQLEQPAVGSRVEPEERNSQPLTRRERQVARLVALGRSNREVAEELVVGVRTVETHLEHIFRKLAVQTRTEVAVWAVQHGELRSR
jgi:predicted ATPase/DNA-binding CsgD family transcriptional regulator